MAEKKEKKPLNYEDFLEQIQEKLGKDVIEDATTSIAYTDVVECTPESLKNALGIGGFAFGKFYLIDGETSGGKSTICYDIIGNVQKYSAKTKKALLIDREDSYTKEYGAALGINNDNLLISKPKTLEDMYTTVTMALESKAFGVIVIDSITSFAPKARFEGSDQMGIESRVNSDKCRVMMEALERSNTLLLGIQQTRQKIGGFGDPTTVSGGTALPFASHCRIRITRSEIDRENEQNVMKFTIIKNKLDKPYKVGTVVYKWGKGFDVNSEYVELALEFGLIEEHKKTYFPPETDGLEIKSKKSMVTYLKDNPEYTNKVIVPLVKDYLSKNKNARNEEFSEEDIT